MTENKRQSPAGRIVAFAIMAAVVLADQLSKLAAVKSLVHVGSSTTAIPGVLDFKYILNSGATAGMLSDHRWIFMTVSTVVIIGLIVYLALGRASRAAYAVSLAMICGGGIGNMIDRAAKGTVVDFLDVTCFDFFPFNTVFNVADVCVCVGCGILIVSVLVVELKSRKKDKDRSSGDAKADE